MADASKIGDLLATGGDLLAQAYRRGYRDGLASAKARIVSSLSGLDDEDFVEAQLGQVAGDNQLIAFGEVLQVELVADDIHAVVLGRGRFLNDAHRFNAAEFVEFVLVAAAQHGGFDRLGAEVDGIGGLVLRGRTRDRRLGCRREGRRRLDG